MRVALFITVLLCGCWDFDGLSSGGERPDSSFPPDLSSTDLRCRTGAAIEDCTNGGDDNGDCLADCADPMCSMTGLCQPVTLVGYGRAAATCGSGTTASGPPLYDDIDSAKPPCSACSCKAPTACTTKLRVHPADMACADAASLILSFGAQGCQTAAPGAASKNYFLETPALACGPTTATVPPEPAHRGRQQLCLGDDVRKDCTTLSCVLAGDAARSGLCIALTGVQNCPDPFSQKLARFRTYTDNRTCTCACTTPAGKVCEGDVTWNKMANCKGAPTDIRSITADVNVCKAFPADFLPADIKASEYKLAPVNGIKCTSTGTVTAGMAKVADPVTVCCIP